MVARLAVAVWAFSFGIAPAATEGGAPPVEEASLPAAAPPAPSFDDLSARFFVSVAFAAGDPAFDLLARIEAEEIAEVAEELFAEGEAALAVGLLHDAVALLTPAPD